MNGTAAAQPIWDDAWAAWLVQYAAQPSGWLIWNDAQSTWQPLPVPSAAPVEEAPAEAEPAPEPTPAADAPTHLHANGPLRSEKVASEPPAAHHAERAGAAPAVQPAVTASTAPAPAPAPFPQPVLNAAPVPAAAPAPAAFAAYAEPTPHPSVLQPAEPQMSVPAAPVQQFPPGPFVHPSAAQLIAAPAPRVPVGATVVLALGVAAVSVGALVTLIGLVSPVLFSIGVGEPRAVAAIVNVLAVLVFPVAVAGAVLGALQLRGGVGPGRDRALIGLGVSGTVALLLLSRGLIAVANWATFGAPLI